MSHTRALVVAALGIAIAVSGCQTPTPEPLAADVKPPALAPVPLSADAQAAARVFADLQFLPQPRQMTFGQGGFRLRGSSLQLGVGRGFGASVAAAFASLAEYNQQGDTPSAHLPVECRLITDAGIPPQGYAFNIGPHGITVAAADDPGAFYAAMTLRQLFRQASPKGVLPFLLVTDHPDFAHRGAMLDISRDKVPTMETLQALVVQFAEWKYNELQLYTEHTFAYPGHEQIWQNASPMTAEEIQSLDAYCRERFIDLVPNQNSFGHMSRWLTHSDYAHLAERPETGYMLCPVDPEAISFLDGLYHDLLPNFSSTMANVGCDEAYEIGRGRSREAVKKRGAGRVYLDFLQAVYGLVRAQGKTMQFWGDIILEHPELIPELPKDVIAMNWGYEANHPFATQAAKFAAAGVPFYVAPGTSSWNAIIGRTDNAVENLRNAAENGLNNGAIGYLVTDWGDGGHWQFLPFSYPGFAYGAAVSWCLESNDDLDLRQAVSRHVFYDEAGVSGSVVYELGNAYRQTRVLLGNSNAFNYLLRVGASGSIRTDRVPVTSEALEQTLRYIDEVVQPLEHANLHRSDGGLLLEEVSTGTAIAAFACKLAIARMRSGDTGIAAIPQQERAALAAEWQDIIDDYQRLWLARNRPGGLSDSVAPFEALLAALR